MLYILQFLRFVAALLVLFFHLGIMHSGYKGVDVFFVISGFVIYYTLFSGRRPKPSRYVINRFTKIFFLYWLALILLYIVSLYTIDGSFLSTVLLLPGHPNVLVVSWSLSYELYFYLLIGLVAYLTPAKYHLGLFLLFFIASSLVTGLDLTHLTLKSSPLNFLLGPNLWEFLLGVLSGALAMAYYRTNLMQIALGFALLCSLALVFIPIGYANPLSYPVYGILSFAIVFFITVYEKRNPVNKGWSVVFRLLGDSSYAMYLFSPIIILIIPPASNSSKFTIILLTIVISIAINQAIERNFLKWSREMLVGQRVSAGGKRKSHHKKRID
jgi:exopolysaccharide production protein ExoZ